MNFLEEHEKAVSLKVKTKDAISSLRKAQNKAFKSDGQGIYINWYDLGLNHLDTDIRSSIIKALATALEKDLQKILDRADDTINQAFQRRTTNLLNEATAIVQALNPSALKPEQEPIEVYVNH